MEDSSSSGCGCVSSLATLLVVLLVLAYFGNQFALDTVHQIIQFARSLAT